MPEKKTWCNFAKISFFCFVVSAIVMGVSIANSANIPDGTYETNFYQFETYANVSIPNGVTPVWGSMTPSSYIIYQQIVITQDYGVNLPVYLDMCYSFASYYSPSNELIDCYTTNRYGEMQRYSSGYPLYLPLTSQQEMYYQMFPAFLVLTIVFIVATMIFGIMGGCIRGPGGMGAY